MKAVLLAAGRSFRMWPVGDKNFLGFLGAPFIKHQIEALKRAGWKDILVIGGKHNCAALRRVAVELSSHTAKISVREQKELEQGMAGAVLTAKSWIGSDFFLLVSANDVLDESVFAMVKAKIEEGTSKKPGGLAGFLLAKKVSSYFPGGYLKTGSRDVISEIVEKPGAGKEPSKLVNIVVHFHPHSKALFSAIEACMARKTDDLYECALQSLFDSGAVYRALPYTGFWQPLKYPWHVLHLMRFFLNGLAERFPRGRIEKKKVEVAKTAVIHGDVYLEEGVRVMDGAVIQGPAYIGRNTVIATNALVRESHVSENCVIGFGSEVARSYLGHNVWTHTNYIGDSIIGNNVSFGAGCVTGNLRLDEKPISVSVRKTWNGKEMEEQVDTGLTKLGLITGDNIRAGINTSFMPGVKIGSDSFVGAGIVIGRDVPESSYVTGNWELKVRENNKKIGSRASGSQGKVQK